MLGRYVAKHPHLLGKKAEETLKDLGMWIEYRTVFVAHKPDLAVKFVVSVSKTMSTIEALQVMLDNNVSAVAVLDGEKLYSNLSASDLRVHVSKSTAV